MADFRKWMIALFVLALFAGLASAQTTQYTCSATAAVPPQLRGEGYTELVGDIVLNCNGGTAVTPGSTANITVYMPVTVTSRLLSTSSISGQTPSEALLLLGVGGVEPNPTTPGWLPTPCGFPFNGAGPGGCSPWAGQNIFQGVSYGQAVTFYGVPVLAPASIGAAPTTYRITNVRINANALNSGAFTGVTAAVSISGSTSVTLNQSLLTVGYVSTSLSTSVKTATGGTISSSAITYNQCSSTPSKSTSPPVALETVRFSEIQGSAFKVRGTTTQTTPGNIYATESGLTETGVTGTNSGTGSTYYAGYADWGTRLKAVFNNIPSGVTIYVSTTNLASGDVAVMAPTLAAAQAANSSYAQLIVSETSPDSGSLPPLLTQVGTTGVAPGIGYVPLTNVNGSATAVWEVTNALANTLETDDFGVFLSYASTTTANLPTIGTATVNLSYAPVPDATSGFTAATGAQASTVLGIPRFADTSTAGNALTIVICQTALLYPYVTEIGGFDTGLAVANTSSDPFGTSAQTGYCTINWYGTAAPATNPGFVGSAGYQTTTPTSSQLIANGTIQAWATSVNAPGFNGYVIAVCNFQYAHGFAFVSDLGARNLAMGYLAIVMNASGGELTNRGPIAESLGQ